MNKTSLAVILLASSASAWHIEQSTRKSPPRPVCDPAKVTAAAVLCSSLWLLAPLAPVSAYEASDYASDAVQTAVTSLKQASSTADTFKAYESIADIITEGKGVGGMINYQGVQLERGYIADEDTTIYNPGLTLLTDSEKSRLTAAVIQSRQNGLASGNWNEDNQLAFEFLREKLDPLHMYELSGYLSIVPFYGAVVYLAVLAVQQLARDLFPVAYLIGVAAIFGPVVALVLLGPQ